MESRNQENNSTPRLLRSLPQPPEELRNHTDSDQELLPLEKSEDTKSLLSFLSESFLSKDLLRKSLTSLDLRPDSRLPPFLLFKKPPRLTSLVFSKTPTSVPFTVRESPLWRRMFFWPEELEERDSRLIKFDGI